MSLIVKYKVSHYTDKKGIDQPRYFKLKFLDCDRFLAVRLKELAANQKGNFPILKSFFPDEFELLSRKGIYPYE